MWLAAATARELAFFAATGFLIGGLDDLSVDIAWGGRALWRHTTIYSRHRRATAGSLCPPAISGRLAIFVPAWREEGVIGAMIATARDRLEGCEWRLYVGTYPNDPATRAAVATAAADDPRIRLVVGDRDGGTTKAGCLNWLWQQMLRDEVSEGRPFKGVVLHDAEDVVHRDELTVFDTLLDRFDLVQIPVEAMPVRGLGAAAALVSGVYSGDFAEAHGKEMVLREAVGAAVPSAGVGCAIRRAMLGTLATDDNGPFDPTSLTEDYELGLTIARAGGRGIFARIAATDGDGVVAVRACFPHTLVASSRQKARWITGIALAGWDRLGWTGGLAERWMRARDRRAPIAALILACAYLGLIVYAAAAGLAIAFGRPLAIALPATLLRINTLLLGWRMLVRAAFTARVHGVRMAALAPLHMLIGNFVAVTAAARAVGSYLGILRGGRVRWDKTAHVFPDIA